MVTATAQEFNLPDVGEGLTEAEIVTWMVAVGDEVKVNDVVCEIETAKSVVELPSPYAGTVLALLVEEGDEVEVGTPIIRIGDPDAAASAPAEPEPAAESESADEPAADESGAAESGADDQPQTLVGSGPKQQSATRRPRRVSDAGTAAKLQAQASFDRGVSSPEVETESDRLDPVAPPATAPHRPGVAGSAAEDGAGPALAKPPVRAYAKERGVDLRDLTPSGSDGVLTAADVDAAVSSPATAAPTWSEGEVIREPIKGLRKQMGQAMTESAFTLPHVTIWTTVDVTATTELVERLAGRREFREVKVSTLLIVAKACLLAMRRTPLINSYWDEDAGEILIRKQVNLGIAAATPRGLQVPNIKAAESRALPDLAAALGDLVSTARSGKTPPADQAGGTFTITNVGPFGMEGGTPIINPGESAILCFGAIQRRPWVVGGRDEERIEPRDVCTLALSFDHRHIDGETGSTYLADVARVLHDPAAALMF